MRSEQRSQVYKGRVKRRNCAAVCYHAGAAPRRLPHCPMTPKPSAPPFILRFARACRVPGRAR